ncbi:GSCFA domain-containing protein [Lutibacter sp.]|uniref:GSCFA domain-containing protein n=1 Tax=Lutibacter sp. TaxID=1925666 RepID=UPI00273247D9|nr:GSCFA domain-containing protein [Lutibacter sp.]MDP3313682.1 GSCFA domain-containing protein [Lutibacter sp.]
MDFRTNINLQKEANQIDYSSKLLLIGSCFSENISAKLSYFKFNVKSNPFGILFNPIAIEHLISNASNSKIYTEKDVFQLNERWHCFDAHSDLSSSDKQKLLQNLNHAIASTIKQLQEATHIIITLGTSWVYKLIETNSVVGNCHKVPQKKFLKELLSVDEITASLENMCAFIKNANPAVTIIFTVSPVRHLKDGFVENSQSKAHLLTSIHQIVPLLGVRGLYFPSYEIMMDDLRDYRFYTNDMLHPNETAINYIWEQFQQVWIDEKTTSTMKEVDSIQKGLAHKPFNSNSEQHQEFLTDLQIKITSLKNNFNIAF